jgi:methylated-DNA-[protein]-cysteine S-methyltransferase
MKQRKISTPTGDLYLVASDTGLRQIFWDEQPVAMGRSDVLDAAAAQLTEYFAGKRTHFDLPLEAEGTEFQRRVWQELQRIPYGKTISYRELARRIGKEKATRAVGTANGRNPLCIVIPCHRVIAADGTLGGYSGGLDKKVSLLGIEGVRF